MGRSNGNTRKGSSRQQAPKGERRGHPVHEPMTVLNRRHVKALALATRKAVQS